MDSHLVQLQQALTTAIAGMNEAEMNWHPPETWCAAEVLEHLYLTYTGTLKGFERVIEAGKPLAGVATLAHRGKILQVLGFGYMPRGRKAPGNTRPRGLPGETVRTGIIPKITELDEIIADCERRWGPRGKLLDHPILGPLSAGQWRKFHLIHGLHHVKQIERLRQGSGTRNDGEAK
jgi:hypothetical protein